MISFVLFPIEIEVGVVHISWFAGNIKCDVVATIQVFAPAWTTSLHHGHLFERPLLSIMLHSNWVPPKLRAVAQHVTSTSLENSAPVLMPPTPHFSQGRPLSSILTTRRTWLLASFKRSLLTNMQASLEVATVPPRMVILGKYAIVINHAVR